MIGRWLGSLLLGAVLAASAATGARADADDDLVAAAKAGDAAKVKAALAHGAHVNAQRVFDFSDIVGGSTIKGVTALHFAALLGYANVVATLLDHGARIEAADAGGGTPLHYAAQFGERDVVALLLSRGASVNVRDASGETPLFVAAKYGKTDVAVLLLSHGADPTVKNNDGIDAVGIASASPVLDPRGRAAMLAALRTRTTR